MRAIAAGLFTLALCTVLGAPALALCGRGFASEDLTNECLLSAFEATSNAANRRKLGNLLVTRLSRAGHDKSVGRDVELPPQTTTFSLRPILEWSSNLNGGQTDKPIYFAGYPFSFLEEDQKRTGLAVGGELGARRRVLPGNGHRIDLSGALSATHATQEDITCCAPARACAMSGASTGRRRWIAACAPAIRPAT